MSFKGVIYKATNLVNRKVYIGQTTSNFNSYVRNHINLALKNKDKDSRYFYCAIRKYGQENFKWEIIAECFSPEELNSAEIGAIFINRAFGEDGIHFDDKFGYNMTAGGVAFFKVAHGGMWKTYEKWVSLYGEEEALRKINLWKYNNAEARRGKPSSLKGKTYEEIFKDSEKAKKLKLEKSLRQKGKPLGHPTWNKGLKAENDSRVATYVEKSRKTQKGRIPWNKGLTKETDERVKTNIENARKTRKKRHLSPWNKGLTKETDERVKKYGESVSISKKKKNNEKIE